MGQITADSVKYGHILVRLHLLCLHLCRDSDQFTKYGAASHQHRSGGAGQRGPRLVKDTMHGIPRKSLFGLYTGHQSSKLLEFNSRQCQG